MKLPRRFSLVLAALLAAHGCRRAPQTDFQQAVERYQQQDYAAAAGHLEHALGRATATPQALTMLGVCRLHQGRPNDATRCFYDALKLQPDYVPARYNLAVTDLQAGHNEAAANALQQLSRSPGLPAEFPAKLATAYNNLAVAAARQRNVKGAEQYLQLALAADPQFAAAQKNFAALKPVPVPVVAPVTPPRPVTPTNVVVTPRPAPPVATQVVQAVTPPPPPPPSPTGSKRRVGLAAKPLVAGDRARAKSLFTDAARLHQQGKLPAAIAGYAKAIAADASYAQPYYNLAIAYRDNRQYDLAFDNYELALQADPQFTDARYNYAILLQNQGYVADALDQYERILRVNPADAAVHLTAAALYARDPATRESARQHYETYLRLSPGSPLARDIRAWLDQNR